MSEYEDENFNLSGSIKSELLRLVSVVGIDSMDIESESDCLYLIDHSIRAIERLQNERKEARSSSKADTVVRESGTKQEKKIADKAKSLEDDLRMSLKTFDDVGLLKAKVTQLMGQVKKERGQRAVLEKFIETQNKKIVILVTHVDKLMKALKRESGKTIKALELNRQQEKDTYALNTKIEKQTKVIAVQNRYVAEIAEGSRILQDQLALMDEKYLELRNRLESSRKLFATQMSRVTKESSELRVKYSMATHGKLLDTLPLPDQSTFNFTNTSDGGFRNTNDFDMMRTGTSTGKKGGKPRASSARAATSTSHSMSNHALLPVTPHGARDNSTPKSQHNHSGHDLNHHEAWGHHDMPHDITLHKKIANDRFVKGVTHNSPFVPKVPVISPAEAADKEKGILRKIHRKSNDAEANGWTPDRLQELIKS